MRLADLMITFEKFVASSRQRILEECSIEDDIESALAHFSEKLSF